jgi:hypothetical protein
MEVESFAMHLRVVGVVRVTKLNGRENCEIYRIGPDFVSIATRLR